MDCSKNPHGFLFGFSHIKFGISGNGILPPTWAKKLHIFGASSLEPHHQRQGTSLLGRWSSWGSRDAQNQRLWWCVLPIQIFDWQKFVDGKNGNTGNEDNEDVMIWDFFLMNVLTVIFYILLRRWLMFNVGWQHG